MWYNKMKRSFNILNWLVSFLEYIKIADGIKGLFINNNRFSTTHISVNLYLPLKRETVAVNALLPYVLSSCCAEYPDFSALNLRLNELYGAEVGGIADKIGDIQVLRFLSFTVNDDLVPDDVMVVEQACALLLSMIFEPSVDGNEFFKADVERERRLTLEKIEGIINDKRSYAINRIIREMYRDEAFGELKTGSAEAVATIDGKMLFKAWKSVLSEAEVRVQVIGKEIPNNLFERLAEKFKGVNREPVKSLITNPKKIVGEVNRVCEKMDVSQGKLVLGFTTQRAGDDRKTADLAVLCDLFGGGPYSKLFVNVREKMSLCYYCAARPNRTKGYLLVDCGVEADNAQKAEKEIINQLNALKNGEITDDELNASISSIKDSLYCLNDSQSALDGWYGMRINESPVTPEEFISLIENVTKEDITKAANEYTLDTVYSIMPYGNEKEVL